MVQQVTNIIWELPWYEVLAIAFTASTIFLVKLWLLWVSIGAAILLRWAYLEYNYKRALKKARKNRKGV